MLLKTATGTSESTRFRAACAAEGLGTAFLLVAVVGSGIMARRLFPDSDGLALLANSLATGGALAALIAAFGPVSGAHFNPVVSLVAAASGTLTWARAASFAAFQVAGAVAGVAAAHGMFGGAVFRASPTVRSGAGLWFAEFVATLGLLAIVRGVSRRNPAAAPMAVGAWIVGAYWFTASTSFANPAVTLARTLTDTFAGIRPADAPGFIAAQFAAAAVGALVLPRVIPEAHE